MNETPSVLSPVKPNKSALSPDLSKKIRMPDKEDPNF